MDFAGVLVTSSKPSGQQQKRPENWTLNREWIIIIIIIAMIMFMVLSSWPKVIARVHPVHLMNVDWAPGGRQPTDQASRLGLWVRRKLAAIIHIHHRHCFFVIITQPVGWYSFYRPTKSGRLSRPKYCSKGAQPVLKTVYRSSCCDKHNCQRRDSNRDPLTPQSDALTTRPLRPATQPLRHGDVAQVDGDITNPLPNCSITCHSMA